MALKKKLKKKEGQPAVEKMKVTPSDMETFAEEYIRLSEQIKELTARKGELSDIIKKGAKIIGTVNDKGSFYVNTDHFVCGSVRALKLKIDEDRAYEYLTTNKDKQGNSLSDCVQQVTKYVVDEEMLGKAVQDDRIDVKTLRENCYTESESFSVYVKKRDEEDAPEVEVSSLKKKVSRRK